MRKIALRLAQLLLTALVVLQFHGTAQAAPTATLSFTTDKNTYTVGDEVTVTIRASIQDVSGGSTGAVVTHDDKLQYVSSNNNGSPFSSTLDFNYSDTGRTLTYAQYTTTSSGVTGDAVIRQISFRAATIGQSTLAFNPEGQAKMYQIGTPQEIPVTVASKTITIQAVATPPPATPGPTITTTPTPTVTHTATPSPTPTNVSGGNPPPSGSTSNATSTPASTTTKKPVAKTPTATKTSTTKAGTVSPENSDVVFSSTTAAADGVDAIAITVILRDKDKNVITDVAPELTGLRASGDNATPFIYDETTQAWTTQITSTEAGIVTATITAQGQTIKSQDLTFNEVIATPTPIGTNRGSSLSLIILITTGLLLLLLLLLFLLRRRKDTLEEETVKDETSPSTPETPLQTPPDSTPSDK